MSEEKIISGYCRVLDQGRMVTVEWDGPELLDADCCYGACVHQSACEIGKAITALLEAQPGSAIHPGLPRTDTR